jgi:hypothetical protein
MPKIQGTYSKPPPKSHIEKRQRARKERAREKAEQRNNQGMSIAEDPELRVSAEIRGRLAKIEDQGMPQNSRRRKAMARLKVEESQRLESALRAHNPIIEVGAGTGSGSDYLRSMSLAKEKREVQHMAQMYHPSDIQVDRVGDTSYVATDLRDVGADGQFLSEARVRGIAVKGGVNANELSKHFEEGSVREIVGANAFGGDQPGQSYGLVQFTTKQPQADKIDTTKRAGDTRFLEEAHTVLKEGGKVRLYGRSNILRKATVEKFGTGKKGKQPTDLNAKQKKAAEERGYVTEGVKKPNPYLDPTKEMLKTASEVGFAVHVKPIKQDPSVTFKRPDTRPDGPELPLGEFNTQFVLRKLTSSEEPGVYLHRDHPRESNSDIDTESDSD